jgi:hypothetical protein
MTFEILIEPLKEDRPFLMVEGGDFYVKISYPEYRNNKVDTYRPFMASAQISLNSKKFKRMIETNKGNLGNNQERTIPVHPKYEHFMMTVDAPAAIIDELIKFLHLDIGPFMTREGLINR